MTKGMSESEILQRFGPDGKEDWYAFRDDEGYGVTRTIDTDTGSVSFAEDSPFTPAQDGFGTGVDHPDGTATTTATTKESNWATLRASDTEFGKFYDLQQTKVGQADRAAAAAAEAAQEASDDAYAGGWRRRART